MGKLHDLIELLGDFDALTETPPDASCRADLIQKVKKFGLWLANNDDAMIGGMVDMLANFLENPPHQPS